MRKRLISFALAATIMVSASLPAFATKKFDMSVFDGKDYVGVVTDDMAGWTLAFPRFGTIEEGGTYIVSDDDSRLSVLPAYTSTILMIFIISTSIVQDLLRLVLIA